MHRSLIARFGRHGGGAPTDGALRTALLSGAAMTGLFTGSSVLAQQGAGVDTIIVTAQKREQSLQDVPIPITVMGADKLRDERIFRMDEVADQVPGFTATLFSVGQPGLTMRGIGSSEDGAGGDNSVAVFLDGVYMARGSSQVFDLFDLERIEVLRGPQGTLYGKNVVGGAINVVSRRPGPDTRARIEGTIGNLNRIDVRGFANAAITDDIYGKVSFSSRNRDGHTFNATTGNLNMDENTQSARLQLLFVPSDKFEFELSGDYSRDRLTGDQRIPGGGIAGPIADAAGGGLANPRVSLGDVDGFSRRDLWGVHGTLNWETGLGEVTSITAYRETDFDWLTDPLGLTPALFFIEGSDGVVETSQQFSQEIRLASPSDRRLTWVGGLYYLNEDADRVETIDPVVVTPTFTFSSLNIFDQANITNSYAVFGEATLALTDRLNVTGGARYTYEKKKYDFEAGGFIAPFGVGSTISELFVISVDETWDAATWKGAIDYRFTDDLMVFASVTRGFKSGGFQGQPGTEASAMTPFNPEFAIDYEIGVKSQLFGDRLRLNVNAFYIDYTDLQITELVATPTNPVGNLITTNAGEAEIKGVELEWDAILGGGFSFSGTYGYLDTEIEEFGRDTSVIGLPLAGAPKHSYSLNAEYRRDLPGDNAMSLRWTYKNVSRFFDDTASPDVTDIPQHDIVDARLAFISSRGFEASLWAKNLFDETYKLQSFDVAGSGFNLFAPPRTWGFTLSWHYDEAQ